VEFIVMHYSKTVQDSLNYCKFLVIILVIILLVYVRNCAL